MSESKKLRIFQILTAIFICTTVLFGASAAQPDSKLTQLTSNYQALETELSDTQAALQAQQDAAISPDEVKEYTNKISDLEAKNTNLSSENAAQAAELQSRQTQIDDLWSRVDAAQKNLDVAYAKIGENQSRAVAANNSDTSTNTPVAQTVYVTNTGSKYHRSGCQYLRQSKISISLDSAQSQGYTACSRCS